MNTEKTIQFIKEGKGLKNEMKPQHIISYLLFMLSATIVASIFQGETILLLSIMISILIIAANVYYFMLKKKSLKHRLLSSIIVALNCVFPVFYIFCTIYYTKFGFKSLILQYFLPFLFITSFLCLTNVALNKKGAYSKSKKNLLISCCELVVIGVLIGRKINMGISSVLNENQHFWVVAFVVLMLMSFVVPAVFVDVLRYYYFTKLEKMGLVTEDILKLDK